MTWRHLRRATLALMLCASSPLSASELELAALVFQGETDVAKPDVLQFSPVPGGYLAPIARFGVSIDLKGMKIKDTRSGRVYEIKPGALFYPACFSLAKTYQRGSIDDATFLEEILALDKEDPRRVTILAFGEWIPITDYMKRMSQVKDFDSMPYITYARPQFVRDGMEPENINMSQMMAAMQGGLMDVHLMKAGVFVMAGQLPQQDGAEDVKPGFKRQALPWQRYPAIASLFDLPDGALAWELGKAGSEEPQLFQKLLPIATHQMLSEALTFGVPLEQSYIFAHAPDMAHRRLYQKVGFRCVARGDGADDHSLCIKTLAEAIQDERFQPRTYSERMGLVIANSKRALSDADALRFSRLVEQFMATELDYRGTGVNVGEPLSRIFVDDRSELFFRAMDQLFEAYGLTENQETIKRAFQRQTFFNRDTERSDDVIIAPEQQETAAQERGRGLYVQGLNRALAERDPAYLEKALFGIYTWYAERMKPFANFGDPAFANTVTVTVLTPDPTLAARLEALGGLNETVKYRTIGIGVTPAGVGLTNELAPIQAVRFSLRRLALFETQLAREGALEDARRAIRQDYWARRKQYRKALNP